MRRDLAAILLAHRSARTVVVMMDVVGEIGEREEAAPCALDIHPFVRD
jgi:hypothetical protein